MVFVGGLDVKRMVWTSVFTLFVTGIMLTVAFIYLVGGYFVDLGLRRGSADDPLAPPAVFRSAFEGNGAFAVPVSVFGNRNFDNGLIELRNELELHGFHTIAAAGIPTEHVFSNKLATGRPDADDLAKIAEFGEKVAKKVADMTEIPAKIEVRGDDPVTAYYTPLGTDGKPAVFLKAKPKTDPEKCTKCGICATVCPMGSIPKDAPDTCTGICIKCHACIKACPAGAKYFDDEAFLSHVEMLKQNYQRRAEAEWFI